MLYITRVLLKDVRCFENAELDLRTSHLGTSVLIAGNNGIGKSAILRAIAMGLCDRDSAASLLRELEGNFIRRGAASNGKVAGEKNATIEIELSDDDNQTWKITTTVHEYHDLIIETVDQKYRVGGKRREFESFSDFWNNLFCVGYGAGLRTTGNAKYSDYFAPDAMYSLFKYDAPLQDPEIAWRRLVAASQKMQSKRGSKAQLQVNKEISGLLKHVLDLDERTDILLEPNGIYIRRDGELIPLDAMGDGHKALLKVTLDILVWYLLKLNYDEGERGEDRRWKPIKIDRAGRPDVRGIVIIDEIEQHLHPRLQREVLSRLSEKFPRVQFIVTTHSPLCVSGTADVTRNRKDGYRLFSLGRKGSSVDVIPREVPRGLRSDQILLDYFELETTLNQSAQNLVSELSMLLGTPERRRTAAQKRRIVHLRSEIQRMDFSLAESIHDREFQEKAIDFLQNGVRSQ